MESFSSIENRISKEALYNYYIAQNNSESETLVYFNISHKVLLKLMHQYGLKKQGLRLNNIKNTINKEELEEYYAGHTEAEILNHFGITHTELYKLLKYFNISRKNTKETFNAIVARVSSDDINNYYIIENHTFSATCEYFNLNKNMLPKLMRFYGLSKPWSTSDIHRRESYLDKYGVDRPLKSKEVRQKVDATTLAKYGVMYTCQLSQCTFAYGHSIPEKEFEDLLSKYGIDYEREFPLGKYRYDFKIENTLVEIDPMATHNSTWGVFNNPKPVTYHQDKSKYAFDNGYQCVHVWDWDDKEEVVLSIKNNTLHEDYPHDLSKYITESIYNTEPMCHKYKNTDIYDCGID